MTWETSWLDEEVCSPLRARLGLTGGPASTDARGAVGSGTGLFLGADGGKSGWVGVAVLSESVGLDSPRLGCVSSWEVSSTEACKRRRASKHEHVCKNERMREINQGMDQR